MRLDYRKIMDLPRPPGALDMGGLDQMLELYRVLLSRFIERDIEPDAPFRIKRIGYFRARVAAALEDVRLARIYNFSLRVKSWVLSSRARRLRLRALIGEARIAHWLESVQIRLEARRNTPLLDAPLLDAQLLDAHNCERGIEAQNNAALLHDQPQDQHKNRALTLPHISNIKPWYRLPILPKLIGARLAARPEQYSAPYSQLDSAVYADRYFRAFTANPFARSIPSIPFWPHELGADYIADDEALGDFRGDFRGGIKAKLAADIIAGPKVNFLQKHKADKPRGKNANLDAGKSVPPNNHGPPPARPAPPARPVQIDD